MTDGEYLEAVRHAVDRVLADAGEPPVAAPVRCDVAEVRARGMSPVSAALEAVGFLRQERMAAARGVAYRRGPYDDQERRVVDYLCARGAGGGMDPVGFLISSNDFMAEQLRDEQRRVADLERRLGAAEASRVVVAP